MDIKELFGVVAVVLVLASYIPLYWGTLRGSIRPHPYTYLVWSITASTAFFSSLISGGGAGSWAIGVAAVMIVGLFIVLVWCRHCRTKDITFFDGITFVLALLALIPWIVTKDPTLSVIAVTIVEALAYLPTMRKTWKVPGSEKARVWATSAVRHAIVLLAISTVSIATALYPTVMICMNVLLVTLIVVRRRQMKKR